MRCLPAFSHSYALSDGQQVFKIALNMHPGEVRCSIRFLFATFDVANNLHTVGKRQGLPLLHRHLYMQHRALAAGWSARKLSAATWETMESQEQYIYTVIGPCRVQKVAFAPSLSQLALCSGTTTHICEEPDCVCSGYFKWAKTFQTYAMWQVNWFAFLSISMVLEFS